MDATLAPDYPTSVQRLIDQGHTLKLTCWRCRHQAELDAAAMAMRAKPGEGQNMFIIRMTCARCGAKSPEAIVA